jgi:CheY-like chemotaxis protein
VKRRSLLLLQAPALAVYLAAAVRGASRSGSIFWSSTKASTTRGGTGLEKRILLVEDDASSREVFARALAKVLASEHLDVSFVEAGSLAEARVRLGEGGLDAALIDVTMPDGDGLELVGEINDGGVGSPIPTLVLTAGLETSVAGRAMEQGARGALSKLASMPETVAAIERLIS